MPVTLLLDLDDTLLDTNLNAFIPAYLQALSGMLADLVAPEVMLPALQRGTKAMQTNLDPSLTLEKVFYTHFYADLNVDRIALRERIDQFYEDVFPRLGSLTTPIPEAIRLVDWAFEEGLRVVIATNPLFPLRAIQHRLSWAGLPTEKYPFALVSSDETFHFTKESVAYYPELLAQLGWTDEPVVMVGDDLEREVKPCLTAGLPVFWVRKPGELSAELTDVPQGTLESFKDWLKKTDPDKLKVSLENPCALRMTLRSTPAALATILSTLPPKAWTQTHKPGEWCLTEIICHLRDVEREVNLPRIRRVLAEENPFLAGEVTDVWVKERHCADQDGPQALVDFTTARKEALGLLDGLETEWSRPARHAIFGPTSLQELTGFVAGHDRAHVQQVWKSMQE